MTLPMANSVHKSKYRNVKTRGFASKREAQRYDELKLLAKAGKISEVECQVRYPIKVMGQLICTYVADFCYFDGKNDGISTPYVVEDCKGFRTPIYKLKAKLMKAIYGIEILET